MLLKINHNMHKRADDQNRIYFIDHRIECVPKIKNTHLYLGSRMAVFDGMVQD